MRALASKAAELAARQHGVIARWQLLELGLGRRAIAHALATGRLHRLHRAVYAFGRRDVPRQGRWMAAVLACGPGALLSHGSAAALWGLARPRPGAVEVTACARRGRGDPGIVAHRAVSLAPGDRDEAAGIPVTSIPRTLLDLAGDPSASRLHRAFAEADRLGLLSLPAVAALCDRTSGRIGTGGLRALVAEAAAPAHTRSELEAAFGCFCRDRGLPVPEANAWAAGLEVDALWRKRSVVVELDGWEFHRGRAAFERDRERTTILELAGFRVYRLTWRRLQAAPDRVEEELRAYLALGESPRRAGWG